MIARRLLWGIRPAWKNTTVFTIRGVACGETAGNVGRYSVEDGIEDLGYAITSVPMIGEGEILGRSFRRQVAHPDNFAIGS